MYDGGNIFTKKKVMIEEILKQEIQKCLAELYSATDQSIQFQKTRKDFKGDVTLVVFPLLRASKKGPEQTAEEIGDYLKENVDEVASSSIRLTVTPDSLDIIPVRNQILKIDFVNTNINGSLDTIATGDSSSGTTATTTSTYVTPSSY